MELMMSADIVFAAADARIGCQHAQYGLVPGWGGSQRLPRLVGMRRAMELMFSANGRVDPVRMQHAARDGIDVLCQVAGRRNRHGLGVSQYRGRCP